MKTDNTDNELIAEFMGVKCSPVGCIWYDDNGRRLINVDDLEYDERWDWLMPVVEKIHCLPEFFTVDMGSVEINGTLRGHLLHCVIKNSSRKIVGEMNGTNTLIGAVYTAVVQFVKWYNSKDL